MTTRITQIENPRGFAEALTAGGKDNHADFSNGASDTILKVEGTLFREDAELLERICRDVEAGRGCITIDLADLSSIDSESASVLCRMKREQGVKLQGLHLFIAKVVELTEAEETASKYLPREADEG